MTSASHSSFTYNGKHWTKKGDHVAYTSAPEVDTNFLSSSLPTNPPDGCTLDTALLDDLECLASVLEENGMTSAEGQNSVPQTEGLSFSSRATTSQADMPVLRVTGQIKALAQKCPVEDLQNLEDLPLAASREIRYGAHNLNLSHIFSGNNATSLSKETVALPVVTSDDGYVSSSSILSLASTSQEQSPTTVSIAPSVQVLPAQVMTSLQGSRNEARMFHDATCSNQVQKGLKQVDDNEGDDGNDDDKEEEENISQKSTSYRVIVVQPEDCLQSGSSKKRQSPFERNAQKSSRERIRAQNLKSAFDVLREKIYPYVVKHGKLTFPPADPSKLSQLDILRGCIDYINYLQDHSNS